MTNQKNNPIFWCFIIILAGAGLLIWGAIKGDCSGPDCWVGSGFLMWSGGILMGSGFGGWFIFGGNKRKQ